MVRADGLVPRADDLPGSGWVSVPVADRSGAGPERPDWAAVVALDPDEVHETAASPLFVREPHALVHGVAAVLVDEPAGARLRAALAAETFAVALGRDLADDLAGTTSRIEVLDVDVRPGPDGHRVTFAGVGPSGMIPVHLDVVVRGEGAAAVVVWFADAPEPFPDDDRLHVLDAIARRSSRL
jgi:hypothetical protein